MKTSIFKCLFSNVIDKNLKQDSKLIFHRYTRVFYMICSIFGLNVICRLLHKLWKFTEIGVSQHILIILTNLANLFRDDISTTISNCQYVIPMIFKKFSKKWSVLFAWQCWHSQAGHYLIPSVIVSESTKKFICYEKYPLR